GARRRGAHGGGAGGARAQPPLVGVGQRHRHGLRRRRRTRGRRAAALGRQAHRRRRARGRLRARGGDARRAPLDRRRDRAQRAGEDRVRASVHALVVLAGALALDLFVGEPPAALHPVVWMGRFYRALRRRAPRRPAPAFAWGALMALAGPLGFGVAAYFAIAALAPWPALQIALEIY